MFNLLMEKKQQRKYEVMIGPYTFTIMASDEEDAEKKAFTKYTDNDDVYPEEATEYSVKLAAN